jgi:hypothetical protein
MTGMIAQEMLVKAVFQAADGEIVGRIRIQKIFYLLEQLGLLPSISSGARSRAEEAGGRIASA